MLTARLATVVVLPSPGLALVTWMTAVGLLTDRNRSEVRNDRYASLAGEVGSSRVARNARSADFQLPTCGMSPSVGRPPMARSKSSFDRIESSRYSKSRAAPMPRIRPTANARIALRAGFGDDGDEGA